MAMVHEALKSDLTSLERTLLLVIIPRHPARASAIADAIQDEVSGSFICLGNVFVMSQCSVLTNVVSEPEDRAPVKGRRAPPSD